MRILDRNRNIRFRLSKFDNAYPDNPLAIATIDEMIHGLTEIKAKLDSDSIATFVSSEDELDPVCYEIQFRSYREETPDEESHRIKGEALCKERELERLKRQAEQLGYQLNPKEQS